MKNVVLCFFFTVSFALLNFLALKKKQQKKTFFMSKQVWLWRISKIPWKKNSSKSDIPPFFFFAGIPSFIMNSTYWNIPYRVPWLPQVQIPRRHLSMNAYVPLLCLVQRIATPWCIHIEWKASGRNLCLWLRMFRSKAIMNKKELLIKSTVIECRI